MFIHAIINGQVYFADNYSYGGVNEGGLHVKSIASYNAAFNNMYRNSMQGAVHFANNDTIPPTISDVRVTDITRDGYTVTCNVSDNTGIRFWNRQSGKMIQLDELRLYNVPMRNYSVNTL